MPDLDLDQLEAVAKAPTPGPWSKHIHQGSLKGEAHINGAHGCAIAYIGFGTQTDEHYVRGEEAEANAAHVAAFDPPTVLALIAAARERDALKDERDTANALLENDRAMYRAERDALKADLAQSDEAIKQLAIAQGELTEAQRVHAELVTAAKRVADRLKMHLCRCDLSKQCENGSQCTGARDREALALLTAALGDKT